MKTNKGFVRIDFQKRVGGSRAIVTCTTAAMPGMVTKYQSMGYQLVNVKPI